MKPQFKQWSEYLLQEIYYTPEHLRAALIEEHLLKAVRRGYTDGAENGWWKEQEAAPQVPLIKTKFVNKCTNAECFILCPKRDVRFPK